MKIALSLFNYGQGIAPVDWNTKDIPTPYRLYYIKGGSAFLRIDNEEFKLKKDHFYFFHHHFLFLYDRILKTGLTIFSMTSLCSHP